MRWFKFTALAVLVVVLFYFGSLELVKLYLDPSEYRGSAARYVEKELDAKLGFHRLRFTSFPRFGLVAEDVEVEGGDIDFSAEKITVLISPLRFLASRRLVITGVEFLRPTGLLKRFGDGSWNYRKLLPAETPQGKKQTIKPAFFSIVDGTFTIIDESLSGDSAVYRLSGVNVNSKKRIFPLPAYVELTANLHGERGLTKMEFNLKTRFWPPILNRNWQETLVEGTLLIDGVRPAQFRQYVGRFFPERYLDKNLKFEFDFSGTPLSKMDFKAGLIFRNKRSMAGFSQPDAVAGDRRFEVRGNIGPDEMTIEKLVVFLPEVTLNGKVAVKNYLKKAPRIKFNLETSFIDVSMLAQLVPPAYQSEPLIEFMQENIWQGRFQLSNVRFEGSYSNFLNLYDSANPGTLSGKMEIRDFELNLEKLHHPLTQINGLVLLGRDRVTFSDISAVYGDNHLRNIAGKITDIHQNPLLEASIDADLDLEDFHRELLANIGSKELLKVFSPIKELQGRAGFDFNISADLKQQTVKNFDGYISFDQAGLTHDFFNVPLKNLQGKVHVDKSDVEVEHLTWKIGGIDFHTSGAIRGYPEKDYRVKFKFDVKGKPAEIARSDFFNISVLDSVKGPVKSSLEVEGNLAELEFRHTADFTRAEYRFHGFLKQKGVPSHETITGRLFNGTKMRIDSGEVKIGKLALIFDGTVEDVTTFDDYDLKIKLSSLNLSDLSDIFPSFAGTLADGAVYGSARLKKKAGDTKYDYHLASDIRKLDIEPLNAILPGLAKFQPEGIIAGWFNMNGKSGDPFSGKGELTAANLGFKTGLNKPFSNMNGKGRIDGKRLTFKNVTGQLGTSHGKLSGWMEAAEEPIFYISVDADVLNFDDVIKKRKPKKKILHKRWNLDVRSKKGTLKKMEYENLMMSFTYYRWKYDFSEVEFTSHNGLWLGDAKLDTENGKRLFEANLKITELDMESFLPIIWKGRDNISGRLDLDGKFSGDGLKWSDLRHTLNGDTQYRASNVIIKNYKNKKTGKSVDIPFDKVNGHLAIKEGVGHTEDTMFEGRVVRMSSVGDFRFNDGTLDFILGIKPFTTIDKLISSIPLVGPLITGKEKSLIMSYYKVSGTFDKPVVKPLRGESLGRTIFGIFQRLLEPTARALSSKPDKQEPGHP